MPYPLAIAALSAGSLLLACGAAWAVSGLSIRLICRHHGA